MTDRRFTIDPYRTKELVEHLGGHALDHDRVTVETDGFNAIIRMPVRTVDTLTTPPPDCETENVRQYEEGHRNARQETVDKITKAFAEHATDGTVTITTHQLEDLLQKART